MYTIEEQKYTKKEVSDFNEYMKEKVIYQANPLESLTNQVWQLQRLQEEGRNVTPLIEEVWDKITDIIHGEDKVKIEGLRERLRGIVHEKIVMEEWLKDKNGETISR